MCHWNITFPCEFHCSINAMQRHWFIQCVERMSYAKQSWLLMFIIGIEYFKTWRMTIRLMHQNDFPCIQSSICVQTFYLPPYIDEEMMFWKLQYLIMDISYRWPWVFSYGFMTLVYIFTSILLFHSLASIGYLNRQICYLDLILHVELKDEGVTNKITNLCWLFITNNVQFRCSTSSAQSTSCLLEFLQIGFIIILHVMEVVTKPKIIQGLLT